MKKISISLTTIFIWTLASALPSAAAPVATAPSFNCAKVDSAAEKLVCNDAQLAALDRETARLFALARDGKYMDAKQRRELVTTQRGWIKGRNDCWKAENLRRCVLDEYAIRIHQLRQGYAGARTQDKKGISMGPKVADCKDFDALIGLTFINSEPPLAVLEWRYTKQVFTQGRSGSGARYLNAAPDGESVFWIKGDNATFDRPGGKSYQCRIEIPG
jgi:uncharacterized protein